MRTIRRTSAFKRDYKRENKSRHSKTLEKDLLTIISMLVADDPLAQRHHDHALTGKWKDHRDCHVKPDLVLIYSKPDPENLDLVRLGSHSELGL